MASKEKDTHETSIVPFVIGLGVVTLVAAGGGFGLAVLAPSTQEGAGYKTADTKGKSKKTNKTKDESVEGSNESNVLVPMQPIITNIGKETKTLIRIESMLVMKEEHTNASDEIVGKVTEDILLYLSTISLGDLEGRSGLLNLMEDLNIRAVARSKQRVSEVLILSLVVE